jgi:hypothetical protein
MKKWLAGNSGGHIRKRAQVEYGRTRVGFLDVVEGGIRIMQEQMPYAHNHTAFPQIRFLGYEFIPFPFPPSDRVNPSTLSRVTS